MPLNTRSESNLSGVHADLVRVVRAAADTLDRDANGLGFIVTEGLRTKSRQAELVKAGASRTMNSRHLTGHAVDIAATVNGQVRWDWPIYPRIARVFKDAASRLETALVWGGDWRTLRDGPHFELDRKTYPADGGDA